MSPETIHVSAKFEKAEEELRSLIYTTLVELSFASTEEKPAIVARLTQVCRNLNDLIVRSRTPEM